MCEYGHCQCKNTLFVLDPDTKQFVICENMYSRSVCDASGKAIILQIGLANHDPTL